MAVAGGEARRWQIRIYGAINSVLYLFQRDTDPGALCFVLNVLIRRIFSWCMFFFMHHFKKKALRKERSGGVGGRINSAKIGVKIRFWKRSENIFLFLHVGALHNLWFY